MNADEMFEKLGFKKSEDKQSVFYEIRDEYEEIVTIIDFDKKTKSYEYEKYYDSYNYVSMQELQAIYTKCKELGWIEWSY